MLAFLHCWLFGRKRSSGTGLWQVVVRCEGETYKVGGSFRGTLKEAMAEGRERSEIFLAEMVMKKRTVVLADWSVEEIAES